MTVLGLALLLAALGPRTDAMREARQAWSDCVIERVVAYSAQPEAAAVLVDAAFGRCEEQARTFRHALARSMQGPYGALSLPPPEENVDIRFQDARREIEQQATAELLDRRAAPKP